MKKTEKRQSLIIATAGLLTRFASTSRNMSTTEIAKAAGVSQPLIYHYFRVEGSKTKEATRAKLIQEAFKYLGDNAPEQAQKVQTREFLIEDSLLTIEIEEPESEIIQVVKETAKDLGISLFDQENEDQDEVA